MPVNVNGVSCILAGGVRETTDTLGTGTYSLRGARTVDEITYRSVIAGIGSGNTSVFTVRLGASFETFIGTVTSGTPAQLTRSQILESSNGNNAVNWGIGDKDLILDAAAAVFHSLQSQIDTIPVTRVKTTTFTSSGTLTTDADTLFAWVRAVGGGGAGGGAAGTGGGGHAEGGGGGAGEYAEAYFTAAQLGASKTVTVGAGGTGSAGSTGGDGTTTNFGSGLLTAFPGSGGVGGPPTLTADQGLFGAGGTGGTGGFLRIRGGDGGLGTVRDGLWQGTCYGGASVLSGSAAANGQTPTAGRVYGGGGAGAANTSGQSARAGANGAAGVCIVVEYLHV